MGNFKWVELRIPVSNHEDDGSIDIRVQLAGK